MTRINATLLNCLFAALCFFGANAHADPLAPGLWAFTEVSNAVDAEPNAALKTYQLTWKRALKSEPGFFPAPVLPDQCQPVSAKKSQRDQRAQTEQWRVACQWPSINQQTFSVSGLTGSKVGVLLRISTLSGEHYHRMLSGEHHQYQVPMQESKTQVFNNYLVSGFEHLLTGLDHVLFVVLLTLLVGGNRKLITTISLFTLGHSVTLSLTVLGYVSFPSALIETLIAFSIILAAAELAQPKKLSLFAKRPGLMSGGFGLLHGMGFAGALSQVGLPSGEIPLALAAFNIGIEIGQLAVIAMLLLALKGLSLLLASLKGSAPDYSDGVGMETSAQTLHWSNRYLTLCCAYAIGITASLWFWQRLIAG